MYFNIFGQPLEISGNLGKIVRSTAFLKLKDWLSSTGKFINKIPEKSVSHTRTSFFNIVLSLSVVVTSDGDTLHINLKLLGPMQISHLLAAVAVAQQRMCQVTYLLNN